MKSAAPLAHPHRNPARLRGRVGVGVGEAGRRDDIASAPDAAAAAFAMGDQRISDDPRERSCMPEEWH